MPVLGQYLCSLLRSASTFEALGCPEDAVCLLKECRALSKALQVGQVHAAAALQLAQIECRRGTPADVVLGYLREAADLQCDGAPAASSQGGGSSGNEGGAYLLALSSRVQGCLHLREGKSEAARAAFMGGLVPLASGLRGSTNCTTGGAGPTAMPGILPGWRAELGALQSSLWLGAADALAISDASPTSGAPAKGTGSSRELHREVDQMLAEARVCLAVDSCLVLEDDTLPPRDSRGVPVGGMGEPARPDTAWRFPTQLGEVLLRRGLWSQRCALLQRPLSSDPTEAWVAGVGSAGGGGSSSTAPLELRFEAALQLDGDDLDAEADAGRKTVGRRGTTGGKGKGAASAGMVLTKHFRQPQPSATALGRGEEASSGSDDVVLLIEVLLHCWATPSLAARALAGLTSAAFSSGHLHAATMCLHLSTGTSLVHQHRMALQPKEASLSSPTEGGGVQEPAIGTAGEASSASPTAGGGAEEPDVGQPARAAGEGSREAQLRRCGDMMSGALAVFREAAWEDGASCGTSYGAEGCCGDSREALLGRLDRLAQPWLRSLLSWLQPGALVCSITLHPDGWLLVSRLEPGCTPLMVMLPEGGATAAGDGAAGGQGTAGSSLLDQMLLRLAEIMQQSAESMRGGGSAAEKTPSQKLEWWQVRVVGGLGRSGEKRRPTPCGMF